MIGITGISHHRSPLAVRERFALSEVEILALLEAVRRRERRAELVVLSTCNRLELCFHLPEDCGARNSGLVLRELAAIKGAREDLTALFFRHRDAEAVEHLLRVAAGLDSMVLGENQILCQMKDAYRRSASRGFTGAVLDRLFHKAFETGKRVRAETALNLGASSMGFAAVELACRVLGGDLAAHPVLLVGAGEAAEMVLRCLQERGARAVTVANRTYERARCLAARYQARAVGLPELGRELEAADILIASTTSPEPLVRADLLRRVAAAHGGRPLVVVDLSVPRAVEREAGTLVGVHLADLDTLQEAVDANLERRQEEIGKAQEIVADCCQAYLAWLSSLNLKPAIEGLRQTLHRLSTEELSSLRHRLPEESFRSLERYSEYLEGKMLGLIVRNLKALSAEGRREQALELVRALFGLEREPERSGR